MFKFDIFSVFKTVWNSPCLFSRQILEKAERRRKKNRKKKEKKKEKKKAQQQKEESSGK